MAQLFFKKNTANAFLVSGGICFILSLIFCFFFSISTSPLYGHYGYDSIVFQLIGKYWAQGHLPYVELWDHKGPYIFFVNCIGYLLTGDTLGIFIIQVLHLSITFYFIYKAFCLLQDSKIKAGLLLLTAIIWLACTYDEGNLTEEYLLPWIAAAVFLTLRWSKKEPAHRKADPLIALLCGIVLGISLMTRLTSAAITCGIMLYMGLLFLTNGKWKDLLKIILVFISGFILVTAPFYIYFQYHNAFVAAWDGTIAANVSVTVGQGKWAFHLPSAIRVLVFSTPFCALILASFLRLFGRDRASRSNAALWLFATLPYFLWMTSSKCFTHYAMITLPLIPALINALHKLTESAKLHKIVVGGLVLAGVVLSGIQFSNLMANFDYSFAKEAYGLAQETIPNEEFDSFVAWECHPSVYLGIGVKPCYSHFFAQEWHASTSDKVAKEILNEVETLQAKWMLVFSPRARLIQDILKQHYTIVASSNTKIGDTPQYTVYRLKDQ